MAKFNIEIEIDWINEENQIDEEIKSRVVSGVTDIVTKKVLSDVTKEVNKGIMDKINAKVDEAYQKVVASPISITDNWGEEKEYYGSLAQAVKKRFDAYMTEKVDSRGQPTNYNSVGTRINYLIDNRLKEYTEKFMKDAVVTIEKNIKEALENKLKDYVGEKLVNLVQLDKFIEGQKKIN